MFQRFEPEVAREFQVMGKGFSGRCKAAIGLVVFVASWSCVQAQVAPAPRTITTAINRADRVMLHGSVRQDLSRAIDNGPADPSLRVQHGTIVLQRSAERQAALDQYLSDVQNAASSEYRKWLTPAQYGAQFGASADDIQTIEAWLQSQGLKVHAISPAANSISFSGTVGQVEAAFATTIESVTVYGETHIANVTEPQVPRAMASAIRGVVGLNNFHPRPNIEQGPKASFNMTSRRIEPELTLFSSAGTPFLYVDPADAATIYDTPNALLNPAYKGTTYDGSGINVGVVSDSDVDVSPVINYRTAFLGETTSNVNLPEIVVDGVDPGTNTDQQESWLDLEVLGGIAPKATIYYYTSANSDVSSGLFNAIERAISDNTVSILSISYGACEASQGTATTQFIGELYQQAAAQGITVTVSTGDSGAAGCDKSNETIATQGLGVNGLGSSPNNIAVGGTDYDALGSAFSTYALTSTSGAAPYYETALTYIPERPWNNSTAANGALSANQESTQGGSTNILGGGGGQSTVFTKPGFQTGLTPGDGTRDVPDVAFLAGNGMYSTTWVVCQVETSTGPDCANTSGVFGSTTTFSGAGGTSAASPAFAGMLALVEQATGSRLGNANDVLYKLAAGKYSTVFHDVVTGNNAVLCTQGSQSCGTNGFTTGFNAGAGYDFASGLGSVDAAAMLANWSSAGGTSSTLSMTIDGSSSPVSVVHGTSLNFAVTVQPATATGVAGLITTEPAAAGAPTLNGQSFTIPISSGSGTGSYNGLPGGQYTVYANYGGDTNTAASQSQPISVNISAEASSTLLSVNAYSAAGAAISNLNALPYGSVIFADSSVYGTAEGYTASLGYARGTMTVSDNGATIGTAPITSGNFASFPAVASVPYPFSVGTHIVTAKYPGDESYSANTSNAVTFVVVKGATNTTLLDTNPTVTPSGNDPIQINITTTSLASAPTGSVTLTANGTTLGTSSNFTAAASTNGTVESTATITVLGSQLKSGTNTVTATYSGDANYAGSSNTTNIAEQVVRFSLSSSGINIGAGSVTGNTGTITVTPIDGFSGTVNLTCAVTASPTGAVSPITCAVPPQIGLSGISPASGILTVTSTASTTGGAYSVTITGTDAATGKITASTTSIVDVIGIPGISLSNSGPITLTAGAVTGNTSTLTTMPINSFSGAVSLSCAVTSMPQGAVSPITCALSPGSVTLGGTTAATAGLEVVSVARNTAALEQPGARGIGGAVLAMGMFFLLTKGRRRKLIDVLLLAVVLSFGFLSGCGSSGGSGTSGTQTQPGTTSGSYVITVTATPVGASAQIATVSVTVH